MKTIALVGLGGALGSVLRYMISILLVCKPWNGFPLATLLINFIGCFVMGFLFQYFIKTNTDNESLRYLLMAGFCGGFTTFSAFSLENIQLIQSGQILLAFLYILSSVLLGALAILLGIFIFNWVK